MNTPSACTASAAFPTSSDQITSPRGGFWRAVIFKEWVKLRVPWLVLLLLVTGCALYLCLNIRRLFALHDAVAIWNTWMGKGFLFWHSVTFLPLLSAIIIGVWQFLPETILHRIRLSLHLPLGEDRVIALHVLTGLLALTLLWLPSLLLFTITALAFFPPEIIGHLLWGLAPPLTAGYATYFLVVSLHLESRWRMRMVLLLLAAGALPLFFLPGLYEHYSRVMWLFAAWTAGLFLLPLAAGRRFREGGAA